MIEDVAIGNVSLCVHEVLHVRVLGHRIIVEVEILSRDVVLRIHFGRLRLVDAGSIFI